MKLQALITIEATDGFSAGINETERYRAMLFQRAYFQQGPWAWILQGERARCGHLPFSLFVFATMKKMAHSYFLKRLTPRKGGDTII